MTTLTAELTELLSNVGAGGVRLPATLVRVLIQYLVDVVKVRDVNEVDLDGMVELSREAWAAVNDGAALPGMIERRVKTFAGASKPKVVRPLAKVTAASSVSGYEEEDEDDMELLFNATTPTQRTLAKLTEDKTAQDLTGVRILVLSLALELGRVPEVGEVLGEVSYGSDPRVSKIVKDQKKAGLATMQKILDSGSDVRASFLAPLSPWRLEAPARNPAKPP